MFNKRRRIFYVDKIFQKKLLILFLGINVAIVVANIIYYLTFLKGEIERNLFRSHISISNINEVIAGDVIGFNILLTVASLIFVLVFYSLTRVKIKVFFEKIKKVLDTRQNKKEEPFTFKVPERFYEIDKVLADFIQYTDKKHEEEEKQVASLKAVLP